MIAVSLRPLRISAFSALKQAINAENAEGRRDRREGPKIIPLKSPALLC